MRFYVDRVKGKRRVKMSCFIILDTRLFVFEIISTKRFALFCPIDVCLA